ncbi:MAG TPA: hypothetical protein VLU96_03915 [Gaiellaceae bacterium]|nr:hypothetical protein [Gaiellaceae bacterium]
MDAGGMDAIPSVEEWPVLPDEDEDREVHLWREEQFRELGFDPRHAYELAASAADLGQARYLARSGCAPELAVRILS